MKPSLARFKNIDILTNSTTETNFHFLNFEAIDEKGVTHSISLQLLEPDFKILNASIHQKANKIAVKMLSIEPWMNALINAWKTRGDNPDPDYFFSYEQDGSVSCSDKILSQKDERQFKSEGRPEIETISESLENPFFTTPLRVKIIALRAVIIILTIILLALFLTHVITLPTLAATAFTATLTAGISGATGSSLGVIILSTLITALLGGIYFLNKFFNSADTYQRTDTVNAERNQDSHSDKQELKEIYSSLYRSDITTEQEEAPENTFVI